MEDLEFRKREREQRIRLDRDRPVVIRFDGKDVTKDHGKYPLMQEKGFTHYIFEAAGKIMKGIPSYIYAVLDEVNIVVLDTERFWERFDDTDLMYCLSIMLQEFSAEMSSSFPGTFFGCTIFQIDKGEEKDYIEERHEIGFANALVYCAKDCHMSPYTYHEREQEDIVFEIQKAGFGDRLDDKAFFNGLFTFFRLPDAQVSSVKVRHTVERSENMQQERKGSENGQ